MTHPSVGLVSLGCPKALVDSERILTELKTKGYELVDEYGGADLMIVNTCGFITSAVEESLETIDEAMSENGRVIVTGCLGARAEEIKNQFPTVLAVTGPHQYRAVMEAVHEHLPAPHEQFFELVPSQGLKLTPQHYAYLKISEGCNHRCSFCIIPSMRGNLVSRPMSDVMDEAERLVASGVKELLIISQDTSAYGTDLLSNDRGRSSKESHFLVLAEALGGLGVWVRLHYVYPYPHVDAVLPLMVDGKLLPYLDVPFQHASQRILKLMRRPAHAEKNLQRISDWRAICRDITVRSTFIVGFPGETDQEFEELLQFLKVAKIDRVGCFEYSDVPGAHANALPGAVDNEIKSERYRRVMETQAEISRARLQAKVGRRLTVLVDELEPDHVIARTQGDAPDIDGVVYVESSGRHEIGDFIAVEITGAEEHDLWAVPAG